MEIHALTSAFNATLTVRVVGCQMILPDREREDPDARDRDSDSSRRR